MISRDELLEMIDLVCPHCRRGGEVRQRKDTDEWVHDEVVGSLHSHRLCLANYLRNSEKYGGLIKDG